MHGDPTSGGFLRAAKRGESRSEKVRTAFSPQFVADRAVGEGKERVQSWRRTCPVWGSDKVPGLAEGLPAKEGLQRDRIGTRVGGLFVTGRVLS